VFRRAPRRFIALNLEGGSINHPLFHGVSLAGGAGKVSGCMDVSAHVYTCVYAEFRNLFLPLGRAPRNEIVVARNKIDLKSRERERERERERKRGRGQSGRFNRGLARSVVFILACFGSGVTKMTPTQPRVGFALCYTTAALSIAIRPLFRAFDIAHSITRTNWNGRIDRIACGHIFSLNWSSNVRDIILPFGEESEYLNVDFYLQSALMVERNPIKSFLVKTTRLIIKGPLAAASNHFNR